MGCGWVGWDKMGRDKVDRIVVPALLRSECRQPALEALTHRGWVVTEIERICGMGGWGRDAQGVGGGSSIEGSRIMLGLKHG